ncbi:MAG: type I DNA topoisomerase [Bacteroidales bacterium]|nr:type I DNA topoisomerase [Bacteroidales bacterium]
MGNLVIVESPSKAKTIKKYLGNDFIVKASFGHIRDLQDNRMSIDVEHGFTPEYVIPADKKKVVAELKRDVETADTVWLASDEDREGEAISWHLCETLGLDPLKTRRITFHEITKDAIQNAVKNPKHINMDLVNAQQARRVLDRLVGFELSPVLWRKVQRNLSAGRVQSVALRLIVDREKEIMAFRNEPFYKVEGIFNPEGAPASVKLKATLDTRFKGLDEAGKFLEDCIGARFTVASVEEKEGNRYPAPPFTTSTLQQEAVRKLHMPVSVTMRVAQSLYERGLITYMRTDSTNLSSLAINTAKDFIVNNYGSEYSNPRQYRTKAKGAQEAHEAIRPTYIDNVSIEGSTQEQKLYSLIWKRTVASQMADAKLMNTSVKINSDKRSEQFALQASRVLFDGFLKVYMEGRDDEEESDEQIKLPKLEPGNVMIAKSINADCKYTQAPPRYSEGTLVKKLEELAIGRPSTWASIIGTLANGRSYIVKGDKEGVKMPVVNLCLKAGVISRVEKTEIVGAEKNKLLPQELGLIVTDFLVKNFPDILNYDFTANVEKDFDLIAEGSKVWNNVIAEFYAPFHKKVQESLSDGQYSKVSREIGIDPADGQMIVAKFGQFGAYVQKGEGENRQFASLGKGQLIENISLEDALKLFQLPRTVGSYNGTDVIATKGPYGPYLKYGESNVSLPRGTDPLKVSLEECIALIDAASSKSAGNEAIKEFEESDIKVIAGRYGPYIKHAGSNFKIPKGTDAATLTEEDCKRIIAESEPTSKKRKGFRKAK